MSFFSCYFVVLQIFQVIFVKKLCYPSDNLKITNRYNNLYLDPPDNDRGRALRFANQFKASSNASRIFVIKAEVLADTNTDFDSRLYSTDPNIYFRFVENFGLVTEGDFLKNVSLDFCERKYEDCYLVHLFLRRNGALERK